MQDHQRLAIRDLNDLLALQHDYLAASTTSHAHLFREEARATVHAARKRHRRQVDELAEAVHSLGGQPRQGPDFRRVVAQGRVALANRGEDRDILRAMCANATELQAAYSRARADDRLTPPLDRMLKRHTDEIATEWDWFETRRRDVQIHPH